ncbi:MAG: PIN domain-containing protein [Desulfurococcales archaeon]|nr:PIN domain-containing protein [Desulfurococcales archaeon]
MDGGEGKEETSQKALVIDTNIIISSMLKEAGYTRRVLLLLSALYPTYTPKHAIEEIHRHAQYLAERKGIPERSRRYAQKYSQETQE